MLLLSVAAVVLSLPREEILPTSAQVRYIGRFDRKDPLKPRCSWPATGVELLVRGKTLQVTYQEAGNDSYQIEIDGVPTVVTKLKDGENKFTYGLPSESKASRVRIIKRTESFVGTTAFSSFEAKGGKFMTPKAPLRRIEVIGDSISCAYGNEGKSQNEHFSPDTENAYLSYASIAARAVDADVSIIAWSGRKMWPDNTIPEIYDLTVPTDPSTTFDFKDPAPDAIVINLATNDFGQKPPEERPWTDAYAAFIARLRTHYPNAFIYPTIGSMMNDSYPNGVQSLTTLRGYLNRMVDRLNDPKVKIVEFETQKMEDGIGADWHPNVTTHQKMAAVLTERLRHDLKW
jgi:hypothetical protein